MVPNSPIWVVFSIFPFSAPVLVMLRLGGFSRALGCGPFIRDFLLGHGPNGSPKINPEAGAPQGDVFYHYKTAILKPIALDRTTRQEEKWAGYERRAIDPERIERLMERCLAHIPYKSTGCRYYSFVVYFSDLHRLGWVEQTGKEESSALLDHYPPGQPRRYFRLTRVGQGDWASLDAPLTSEIRRFQPPENSPDNHTDNDDTGNGTTNQPPVNWLTGYRRLDRKRT